MAGEDEWEGEMERDYNEDELELNPPDELDFEPPYGEPYGPPGGGVVGDTSYDPPNPYDC